MVQTQLSPVEFGMAVMQEQISYQGNVHIIGILVCRRIGRIVRHSVDGRGYTLNMTTPLEKIVVQGMFLATSFSPYKLADRAIDKEARVEVT